MTGVASINMKVPEYVNEGTVEKVPGHGKRTLTIIAAVFFGVLVVSAITLTAVYFGSHLTHKAYKGQAILHTADGETIKETIEVRENEVEINEPAGQFSVITDYEKRLSVFKVVDDTSARCFVSQLNTSVVGTRKDMKKRIRDQEQFISADTPTVEYVSTKREVTPTLLGESALIMCGGLDIEWLAPSSLDASSQDKGLAARVKRCPRRRGRRILIIRITIIWGRRC